MNKRVDISPFWFLLGLTFTVMGLGLGVMIWTYGHGWGQTLWHVCQSGVDTLHQHFPLMWQLFISTILAVIIGRGGWSLGQQIFQTRHFARLFWPFQERPPTKVPSARSDIAQ